MLEIRWHLHFSRIIQLAAPPFPALQKLQKPTDFSPLRRDMLSVGLLLPNVSVVIVFIYTFGVTVEKRGTDVRSYKGFLHLRKSLSVSMRLVKRTPTS
jgi:hypothetical protein